MIDGWFASVRKDGLIARGHKEITVGTDALGQGINPDWFDDHNVVIKDFDDRLYKINIHSKDRQPLTDYKVVDHAAGGGQWIATGGGRIFVSAGRDGSLAWVVENGHNRDRSIILEGTEIHRGIVNYAMVESGHVVWSRFEPREVWGARPGGQPEKLSEGLFGRPVMTSQGPFVLAQTHTQLLVFPWGSTKGYVVDTGNDNNLYPDVLETSPGFLVVAWNTHDGKPGHTVIDLSAPRTELGVALPPPPIDPPKEEPTVIEFTPAQREVITQMWPIVAAAMSGKFPDGTSKPEDLDQADRRIGTRVVAEQLDFSFPGAGFGTKSSTPNNPQSKDGIARKIGDKLFVKDIVDGGSRTLRLDGHFEDVSNQHFIEVTAFNHLGSTPPPPPTNGTHPYTRDDDERNECNFEINGVQCNEPREAAIHQVTPPDKPEEPPVDKPPVEPKPTTCSCDITAITAAITLAITAQLEAFKVDLLKVIAEKPSTPTKRPAQIITGRTARDYGHTHGFSITIPGDK